jgi:acyl-CoA reductase-like NAD-dependent aldehyde dehydrogenase
VPGDVVTRAPENRLLIGGRWLEPGSPPYEVLNPATEEPVGLAPNATPGDAEAAAAAAKEAFPAWSSTTPEERAELLQAAARRASERIEQLVPLIIAETGATASVGSKMQVPVCIERLERYANGALQRLDVPISPVPANATPLAPGALMGAVAVRQPVGVVACVTSYNFPIVNMSGKIAPALAMGNTIVVKPAPQDPLSVIELVKILDEVGFPPGVVNVVNSSGTDAAAALVESPDVDMVSFTGSTSVGTRIAEAGARTMKRLLLELGGKGACLVFEDADLDKAVTALGSTFAFHSGQICTAPTRAIVHRSVYDEVVDRLARFASVLKVGDPLRPDTVVGPLISAQQRERVESYIRSGVEQGAKLVYGGGRPSGLAKGFYVEPTLFASCTNEMRVAREEIFGPVLVVIPFEDEEEGIAIANGSDYGLFDYVFSGDTARAYRVARRLRCGNVGLNTAQRNMEAPFGGFKMSGVGRDGGDFGLYAYGEIQSIVWPG